MLDCYDTARSSSRASLKIQRSEFIGIALHVETEDEFGAQLTAIQKEYFDATHHCWGYRLFSGGTIEARSSDAGEQNGTAGKPIANAIVSASLYDTAVVVVRYYGGVKLGTGGLARAYRDAAQLVLAECARVTRYVYDEVRVRIDYAQLNAAYRLVSPPDTLLQSEEFGAETIFTYAVRRSQRERFLETLTRQQLSHD